MELRRRFFQEPQGSYFLFGPRGTGKSTWLKEMHPDALYIDLLLPDVYRAYLARPERLLEIVAANPASELVIIDEVQRAPDLLPTVHHLVETRRDKRFILTGSSARKLKRAGTDLLAGRLLLRTMHPYLASELRADFSLEQSLKFGMVPLVVESTDRRETTLAYVGLYVKEEIQAEGLVRNAGSFARFLESVSFCHASPLNVATVARDAGVERKTVEAYISILEDLLLSFRVPVFHRRAKRILSSHSKMYLFDAGIFRALRPSGPLDRVEEAEGPALEGLVAQHLRAWAAARGRDNSLFFWRTKSGLEVDLVMYGEDGLWALEVKNNRNVHRVDLRALREFKRDYPEAHCLFLYRGSERRRIDDVLCLPCAEFLLALKPSEDLVPHDRQ
jgi:predicted AAA+ superfamily ATPase